MKTMQALLAEHPFFTGLEERHLHIIAGCAREDRFGPPEYIFREGEKATMFYVIHKGTVALETFAAQRGPITIETIEAGEVLGWSWFFPPYHWQFSAHVIEPTQLITLDGERLRARSEEDHDFGYELVRRLAQVIIHRLQATRLQLLDVYGVRPRGGL